jgi:sugar phosphate isomerase/epimerase
MNHKRLTMALFSLTALAASGAESLNDAKAERPMTNTEAKHWPLSYYINAFGFDDKGVFFEPEKVRAAFAAVKKADVPWVAIAGTNLLEPARCDVRACVARIREWLVEFGYLGKVSSVHLAAPTYARLADSQEPVRANLLANVEMFRALEPKALVIHAGTVYMAKPTEEGVNRAYPEETARYGEDAIIQTVAANLTIMADAARPYGIRLALENLPAPTPLGGPENLPRLVKAIDLPNVGYCIDSGHAHLCGQSVTDWLRRAGPKIFETHFHDNRGIGKDEHLPAGFGTISWLDVIATLREIEFPGPVTFETGGWPLPDTAEGFRQAMAWWQTCESMALKVKRP